MTLSIYCLFPRFKALPRNCIVIISFLQGVFIKLNKVVDIVAIGNLYMMQHDLDH